MENKSSFIQNHSYVNIVKDIIDNICMRQNLKIKFPPLFRQNSNKNEYTK